MLEVSQILQCKQWAARGTSIREIARRLNVSRNTVRHYLRGAEPGAYRLAAPRPQPARERVRTRVRELLKQEHEKQTPRKQRLTGARIHRLLEVAGLPVSERTVRAVVAEVRLDLRDPLERAYLPLEYRPGQDAQVDFFEAWVDDPGEGRVKRHVLQMRACYSRRTYRYAAPNQTREALLEGLMRAFEFFEGVFPHVWFDNLTPAVRKVLKGRDRQLQRAFAAFQAHYGFQGEFCRPGKGNEKGGVENEVRRSRGEAFAPIPTVEGREGLQAHLDAWAQEDEARVVRGETTTVRACWSEEAPRLLALPPKRFDAATTRTATVTPRSWIQTGTNFYSVPVHLVGRTVTVKLLAEEVVIFDATGEVARHRRCYGQHRMVLALEHYLPLLERKHRGLDRAVPMQQWLRRVPPCWPPLLAALRQAFGEVDGSKDFLTVVKLVSHHGLDAVTHAVEQSLASGCVSVPVIRYHLGLDAEAKKTPVRSLAYAGPRVHQGSPAAYLEVLHG